MPTDGVALRKLAEVIYQNHVRRGFDYGDRGICDRCHGDWPCAAAQLAGPVLALLDRPQFPSEAQIATVVHEIAIDGIRADPETSACPDEGDRLCAAAIHAALLREVGKP
jgi:hypothetical protein